MVQASSMMKGNVPVLTTSYLCRNPDSPSITYDCSDVPELPNLPDLPPCDPRVTIWWIVLVGLGLFALITGVSAAVYNRKYLWKLKPYPSTKEKKEEKSSVSMQQKEQP